MKKRIVAVLLLVAMALAAFPVEAAALTVDGIRSAVLTGGSASGENPFTDVHKENWYFDAVRYARLNGLFQGVTADLFEPAGIMTRAMFVTVLGRMAGVDVTAYIGQSAYSDVSKFAYYAPYVAWATKHGIAVGVGNGRFDPNGAVTREEMAVFFDRYFEIFGVKLNNTGAKSNAGPEDLDKVSSWARESVLRFWQKGLLIGDGRSFDPKANATRAQVAELAMRMDKTVQVWYKEPGVQSDRVRKDLPEEGETGDNPDTPGNPGNPGGNPGNPGGGNETKYFSVTFEAGSLTDRKLYPKDTLLSTLPAPAQPMGKVFLGWHYKDTNTPVTGSDKLAGDVTLVAKFADANALDESGTLDFVAATDQEPGFSITVKYNRRPVEGVDFLFRNITAPARTPEDGGDPDDVSIERVNVEVNGDGFWVISAKTGGFTRGHTYQIELLKQDIVFDENADVFGNIKQANRGFDFRKVRYFNFSIYHDGTLNLQLRSDIVFLEAGEFSLGEQARLMQYAGLLQAGASRPSLNGAAGSFSYGGATEIRVGDVVAVYTGDHPYHRLPVKGTPDVDKTENGEVAYVKITDVQGTTYYYVAAEAEDVLFLPDVLPVNVTSGQGAAGWTPGGTAVTVDNDKLDFSTGYEQLGLSAETTVDVGDFLAFYTGTLETANGNDVVYVRIIAVTVSDETTCIAYELVDEYEVYAAMDLYDEKYLTEDEVQKAIDENRDAIESSIIRQLEESDFLEQAGRLLARLSLETDEVKEVFGDGLTLSDVNIYYGTPQKSGGMKLMGNIVEKETDNKSFSVTVTPKLTHFDQIYGGIGLHVEVAATYTFEIKAKDGKTKMEIALTALFEQEVALGLSVTGGAVWKKAWIIPYIADYQVSGNLDMGTYTAVGITALATLTKDEDPVGMVMPKGLNEKDLHKKIINLSDAIREKMETVEKVFPELEGGIGGDLAEKYADFMDDANDAWIDLVKADLVTLDGAVDPFHLIAWGLDVDFVISANLNVAMGLTFHYENFKRHTFSLSIKTRKAESGTIDLATNGYQFDVYVMGSLGLRAGIRAKLTVGLFSTKLAGVGLQVEGGVYARLWGFFYYHIENWKVNGTWEKDSGYSGALLAEAGYYLEISFIAEALNGKYQYAPTLYEKEWPFLTVGRQEHVYDFAYEQAPDVTIVNVKEYPLSGTIFNMFYMDLKSGENGLMKNFDSTWYEDRENEEYFAVTLSNDNFSYDPRKNHITIRDNGEQTQTSEMTITWKGNSPLSGTSETISRTFTIYWENKQDFSSVVFDVNGGSSVELVTVRNNGTLERLPEPPTRNGYDFGGWYLDEMLTEPFDISMPITGNTRLYAKWTPKTVSYTVEHRLLGSGKLLRTTTLFGAVGSPAEPAGSPIEGYRYYAADQVLPPIAYDGSTKVTVWYAIKRYTMYVYFTSTDAYAQEILTVNYGYPVMAPMMDDVERPGYVFAGWYLDKEYMFPLPDDFTMPDHNVSVYGKWIPQTVAYKVRHIRQTLSGAYPDRGELVDVAAEEGKAGEWTNARPKDYEGFTVYNIRQTLISGSGGSVEEIYYSRNKHSLSWDLDGGHMDAGGSYGQVAYGENITAPSVSKMGYTFGGWMLDGEPATVPGTMPDRDLAYKALWVPDTNTFYMVWHILQNLSGSYELAAEGVACHREYRNGTTGEPTQAAALTFEGFEPKPFTQLTINPNGSTVVKIYYERQSYNVTWVLNGGRAVSTLPTTKLYGADMAATYPVKDGYVFLGWYLDEECTRLFDVDVQKMPASDLTLYAGWRPRTDMPYTMTHFIQILEGGYAVHSIEIQYGTTGGQTNAVSKEIEGFTAAPVTQQTILGNGTTNVIIYYTRNTYTITWNLNGGNIDGAAEVTTSGRFESGIAKPGTPKRTDYVFAGWFTDESCTNPLPANATVPAGNMTVYAGWTYIPTGTYLVKHVLADENGGFTNPAVETETLEGKAGEYTQAAPRTYEGFAVIPSSYSQEIIEAGKEIVIEIRYRRYSYTIRFNGNGAESGSMADMTAYYGVAYTLPALGYSYPDYSFEGWNTEPDGSGAAYAAGATVNNLLTGDGGEITLYAMWSAVPAFEIEETGRQYPSLSRAMADLQENQTVVMVGDYEGTLQIPAGFTVPFTLDLNGHTLSSTGYGILHMGSCQVTVTDSAGTGRIVNNGTSASAVYQANALGNALVLRNVTIQAEAGAGIYLEHGCQLTIEGENTSITTAQTLLAGCGNVTIYGGTFTTTGNAPVLELDYLTAEWVIHAGTFTSPGVAVYMASGSMTLGEGVTVTGSVVSSGNKGVISLYKKQENIDLAKNKPQLTINGAAVINNAASGYAVASLLPSTIRVTGEPVFTAKTYAIYNGTYYSNSQLRSGTVIITDAKIEMAGSFLRTEYKSSVTITNSTISVTGYAVYNNEGNVTVTNSSLISSNSIGTVYNVGWEGMALTISGGQVNNTGNGPAIYSDGGKVVLKDGAVLTSQCTTDYKGTVTVWGNKTSELLILTVSNNVTIQNTAETGVGIYNRVYNSTMGTIAITNKVTVIGGGYAMNGCPDTYYGTPNAYSDTEGKTSAVWNPDNVQSYKKIYFVN